MKTPITYYGGKISLINDILPLIPAHKLYVEGFAGGLAIFFAKEPSKAEVINDLNANVVNFYKVLKDNYTALKKEVDGTLYSRDVYDEARIVLSSVNYFSATKRAWAFWVLTSQTFNSVLDNPFGYDRAGSCAKRLRNKTNNFSELYSERLRNTIVESIDVLSIIRIYDAEDTFFYLDPPYVGAAQGHYKGYVQKDFDQLLSALKNIKGKFLLSSYTNPALTDAVKEQGWHTKQLIKNLSAAVSAKTRGKKVEVLTWNYYL